MTTTRPPNRPTRTAPPPGDRAARLAVRALAVLGTLLLATGTALELSDLWPRAEMWTGAAASAAYLVATVFIRGSDERVLGVRARLLVGAGLAALISVVGLWQVTDRAEPRVLLLFAPVTLLFVTAALAVREASRTGRAARARDLRSRLAGEEAERRRWVRELHDDTLQGLAALDVFLATAATAAGAHTSEDQGEGDEDSTVARIGAARGMVHQQIRTLRELIAQMRPLSLDALGLAPALADLAARATRTGGIPIVTDIGQLPRLPADVETAAYRIVQEALSNAVRHSGAAHITVSARAYPDRLELSVTDDGRGLPDQRPRDQGYGLISMRERAGAVAGTLAVTGRPGTGTAVRLRVPLPVGPAAAEPATGAAGSPA